MREREYLPLIPKAERILIKRFLATAFTARGWTNEKLPLDDAWSQTMELAAGLGSWSSNFELSQLTDQNVLDLVLLLECKLLGGCLVKHMLAKGSKPISCQMMPDSGHESWICVTSIESCIRVNVQKWSREVSTTNWVDFEGAHCSSRLEVLCHTLAHELVHVVVLNYWPEMDACCPAYVADSRHGPIFRMLNNRLFGHSTTAYKPRFWPVPPCNSDTQQGPGEVAEVSSIHTRVNALHSFPDTPVLAM